MPAPSLAVELSVFSVAFLCVLCAKFRKSARVATISTLSRAAALAVATMAFLTVPALSQQVGPPPILRQVSVTQRLNEQIPPEIIFHDENGNAVHLGDYFGKKPIVLSLVYF